MREIKFRAWATESLSFKGGWWSDKILLRANGKWMWEHHHCMNVSPDHENYKRQWDNDGSKFIIEQYTGLKDKNGKEIYEGDIISTQHPKNFAIKWFTDRWLPYDGVWKFATSDGYKNHNIAWGTFEIIGNIHENPELLKP